MNPFIIFEPLKDKKSLKFFVISGLVIAMVYVIINVLLFMFTIGIDKMPLPTLIQFSTIKAFSSFTTSEGVFLILFPIVGGLLFANYHYWKCKPNSLTYSGIFLGFLSTMCIACILPVLGLAAFSTIAFQVGRIVKYSVLILLVAAMYYVALKQQKCNLKDKK